MQEVISSKVHNELLRSMRDKTEQGKNTRKDVYRLRYLNVEAEALRIREEEKKQDNHRKENEAKA